MRLPRFLHFFGTGVLDQILLSGANFVAGFLMIRYTSDVSYGQFVLAQSAVLLVVSAQAAWLSGPVTIVAPAKSPELRTQMIGSLGASQTRFLRRLAGALLAISLAAFALSLWRFNIELVVAGTILAAWAALQREYRRSVLLLYSRAHAMFGADAIYVGVLLLGIALAMLLRPYAGPVAIVALAMAALTLAQLDFDRAKTLVQKEDVSRAEYDRRQAQLTTSAAGVTQALAGSERGSGGFGHTGR